MIKLIKSTYSVFHRQELMKIHAKSSIIKNIIINDNYNEF
jgi:hypothetical protein